MVGNRGASPREETKGTPTKDRESCGLNNNSFIPALKESERFINFLIKRFNLALNRAVEELGDE